MPKSSAPKGFTLVELLVVITIIGILAVVGLVVYSQARKQAEASRMASDFQAIADEARMWSINNLANFPEDDSYQPIPTTECGLPTADNPLLSDTFLKPYLGDQLPLNPITNREYRYDQDEKPSGTGGDTGISAGFNILAYFCTPDEVQKGQELAINVDKILDKGDGFKLGSVKWQSTGTYFVIYYRVARHPFNTSGTGN